MNIEDRIARIEKHLDMSGVQNRCDRCGRLDTVLFKVCGTFWGEKRYCFSCIAKINMIKMRYWIEKVIHKKHGKRWVAHKVAKQQIRPDGRMFGKGHKLKR